MNQYDIRHFTLRLMTDHEFGWADDHDLLAQVMGFRDAKALIRRIRGEKRISAEEQTRMSDGLDRILDGEVICERRLFGLRIVGEIVYPPRPKPLLWKPGHECRLHIRGKGVKLVLIPNTDRRRRESMPTFRSLFR